MMSDIIQCDVVEQQLLECENVCIGNNTELSGMEISGGTRTEKRLHNDSDEEELVDGEGFTLVRRRSKRIASNSSVILTTGSGLRLDGNNNYEVCISSYNLLPKQIGLVKLLKAEKIRNTNQIKYKNPCKVIIIFDSKEDADTLINNKTFSKSGYRCYSTSEVGITYGVVKNMELDVKEEELKDTLNSEYEIISTKRLKRMSENGEWTNSETVRFGFKSSRLPPYVYGYGGRFKLEPYTFPVTQCSLCWKYGHLTRTCPTKKTLCAKCGGGHANWDATVFQCIDCKGEHTSFDKSAPYT